MRVEERHGTRINWRAIGRRHVQGFLVAAISGTLLIACGGAATATLVPAASAPAATSAPSAAAVSAVPSAAPSAVVSAAPTAAASSAASVRPSAAASAASSASGSGAAVQKVNANTATVAELQAAFQAAGIANAAKWAREVEEYRPYPTNDPAFAKLRAELAKYNPGPGVVDQIIAVLTLQ